MDEFDINEVLEYANDLKREYADKEDVDNFNQAVMRLKDAVQNLTVIDSFDEIREE